MAELRRWGIYCTDWQFDVRPADDGLYVLAADAEDAIAAARAEEQKIASRWIAAAVRAGEQGVLARANRDWLREVIVANLMDGDDGGTLQMRCTMLADELADIISDALRGLDVSE